MLTMKKLKARHKDCFIVALPERSGSKLQYKVLNTAKTTDEVVELLRGYEAEEGYADVIAIPNFISNDIVKEPELPPSYAAKLFRTIYQ